MIGRLAVRSLTAHPVRSAVLAAGFGAGVAVMAILLGVAEIVLSQAQSPALVGGGDVVIHLEPALPVRMVMAGTLEADQLRGRIRAASPTHNAAVYFVRDDHSTVRVDAHGGIPSLEQTMGDPEVIGRREWRDTAEDLSWTQTSPAAVLRQIDHFHPVPDAPEWRDSWAEWLYFNGRARDARFYLTFMVGPARNRTRQAGVRLQLDRGGHVENFSAPGTLTDADAQRAPELSIGGNTIRLDGLRYVLNLNLRSDDGRIATGRIAIEASPGRLVPPIEIGGARGWVTGYVVPVMSGKLDGDLEIRGPQAEHVSFAGGAGYHDHNWGFWKGVSWQWGQAQEGDLSLIFGRVRPPADAADPERIPGFIGALGPDGPLGYTTNVTINETNHPDGQPKMIDVVGRGRMLDVHLKFEVGSVVTTRTAEGPLAAGLNFLQMRGQYSVDGHAGDRSIDFTAPGSAETFREAAK